MNEVQIVKCDFDKQDHQENLLRLMEAYMMDRMGQEAPMTDYVKKNLIPGLAAHPGVFVLFARQQDKYIGMTTCFIGFSSFQAKKLINIHDLIVLKSFRGQGIGRKLLQAVESEAGKLECGKITLEVRHDNINAQGLYVSQGFGESHPPMYFWSKYL
ncbi:MAG: GNAT family N-acetyltransferase [Candidatus Cyclobacteriaceae bacterium M3_2C_046]